MDIARAMYLGGEIIYAHQCNYLSYDNEGLLCFSCHEPVYLKKGDIRKPHFAHFHATNARQVEQCELRASSYGNSTEVINFIQNRGQRLKIFQQHFLSLITFEGDKLITNLEFKNWINSIKNDNSQIINSIITNCIDYFRVYYFQIANKYFLPITNNNNKSTFIQQEIALEAIRYLCVKSSMPVLEFLVNYSIYRLNKNKNYKLFKHNLATQNIDVICNFVIKIIMSNCWIKAINEVKDKLEPIIKRNYYILSIHYGKEQYVIQHIAKLLKINAVPEFNKNVDRGLINSSFTLDSLILDIAYPHQFDIKDNQLIENYKSYLFIEIGDIYDKEIIHNIIEPFFKNIPYVVAFLGLKLKSPVRKKQIYSESKREIVDYYQHVVKSLQVTKDEIAQLKKSSFSIYDTTTFVVGDVCWLNTKNHRCKVTVTKVLSNNMYQVMGRDKFKHPVAGELLTRYDG